MSFELCRVDQMSRNQNNVNLCTSLDKCHSNFCQVKQMSQYQNNVTLCTGLTNVTWTFVRSNKWHGTRIMSPYVLVWTNIFQTMFGKQMSLSQNNVTLCTGSDKHLSNYVRLNKCHRTRIMLPHVLVQTNVVRTLVRSNKCHGTRINILLFG